MSGPEENSESKNKNENTSKSANDNTNQESTTDKHLDDNNSKIVAESELIVDNKKTSEGSQSTITSSKVLQIIKLSASSIKKNPKIVKKDNDDIEEFDTSEEEEEENKVDDSKTGQQNYSENITYKGDKCIYTEPGTGRQLIWNSKENKWCAEGGSTSADTTDAMKNYEFDGKNYVYTDKTTNVTYKFIQDKNEWVVKDDKHSETKDNENDNADVPKPAQEGVYGFENDTHTYTDPSDGTSYIWDREKNAWFPKVDDDFMARYQMSYGFTDNTKSDTTESEVPKNPSNEPEPPKKLTKEEKKAENKRKNQEPPTWFDIDEAHNTTIYISNLPLDVTMEELKELVTKCGLLARDEKGKDKLKLYTDADGEPKGDARCTYIKIESVDLALNILDGWQMRDKTLSVQRAKFQLKGAYDPSLKPKRKKKDKDKQKKIHEKLLDWRPDKLKGEPLKCERVVIIKNLFKPEDFDKDVTLLLEYQQDVRKECIKCGEVKKVTIYDRHPEGVAQVTFKEPEEAQACIQLLNGRWFDQRRITAEIWDGKTKYKILETEEQIEARINKWDKFLEEQDDAEEKAKKDAEAKKSKD
ncbi:HIV Tat-specific factor 1 homolog [Nasonia vitripennis]|uniref:RRM domain-containing protein n=1 Tax=Nasonia vitripennis TaxID=7425 RepID=A0A7M7QVR1_NASVI|nr:HIV Tat-specific factor 1 homolog [Nasonia vitripennis]XP_032455262.1 HIV Tat-specific factor 1 homolog [Nasonia vitripennis]